MLIAFASPRAEQERDVLTTSANSLQPLRPHPPLASSPPKKRVVFAPHDNIGRLPPPSPHGRSLRDPKIPIAPAQPNRASSSPRFPPYEAFGRRPRAQSQRRLQRAGVRNPSVKKTGHCGSRIVCRSWAESGPRKIVSGRTGAPRLLRRSTFARQLTALDRLPPSRSTQVRAESAS